jgi:HSP20 family protein
LFDGGWDYEFSPGFDPRFEMRENDDAVTILFELPGVKREDVHIDTGDGLLRIHGERKAPQIQKDEECRCSDLGYGAFDRSFKLPDYADAGKVTAKLADGMLELTIPKIEEKKRVAVEIKVE